MRDGTVNRDGPRWLVSFPCGHTKIAGYTMPVEELRKRKLVDTYVDPERPRREAQQEARQAEARERSLHFIAQAQKNSQGGNVQKYY